MSRLLTSPPGTSEHDLLIDLAHRLGYRVHVRGADCFELTKDNRRCFCGTAAEIHRWIRDKAA